MRVIRPRALLFGAALLALAGCGGGGGGSSQPPPPGTGPPASVANPTVTTPIQTATAPVKTAPSPTSTSPEDKPGGAGDETPIATQALFTGKGGDITPPTVQVPPFIAVKVILHSADGDSYGITVAKHQLTADSSHPTDSVTLSGLRAGKRYAVTVIGAPERLAIVANAEPGP